MIFKKSVKKPQVSLKSYKNNGYVAQRTMSVHVGILVVSSKNAKCFTQKLWRESKQTKHTIYVQ